LAPIEEVNDICFRILCKKSGAGLTWTELTSPLSPRELDLDDKPILQLFGTDTKGIEKFMKKYDSKVSGWDFNLGCPAKTAKKFGYGAYLKNLESIEKILKTMRKNTKKLLFVKIRKSKDSFKILKIAEKYCDAITIHPRTVSQGYSGEPDVDFALKLKKASKIPVVYSGNVDEKNYENYLKNFDAVMIGRKAIGNPNIFSKILGTKKEFSFKDYLKLEKKYPMHFRQLKFQAMNFTKGKKNSRKIRNKIVYAKSREEVVQIFFENDL
jgi:tRNA-dihydrouridine synthase